MAKTPTERIRDYRKRHPDMAKKFYASSRKLKKERAEKELMIKREKMAEIMKAVKR